MVPDGRAALGLAVCLQCRGDEMAASRALLLISLAVVQSLCAAVDDNTRVTLLAGSAPHQNSYRRRGSARDALLPGLRSGRDRLLRRSRRSRSPEAPESPAENWREFQHASDMSAPSTSQPVKASHQHFDYGNLTLAPGSDVFDTAELGTRGLLIPRGGDGGGSRSVGRGTDGRGRGD